MEKLWRNWTIHNLLAHPLMEIIRIISLGKLNNLGNWIHDQTLPQQTNLVVQDTEHHCQNCSAPVLEHEVDYGNCIQCMYN